MYPVQLEALLIRVIHPSLEVALVGPVYLVFELFVTVLSSVVKHSLPGINLEPAVVHVGAVFPMFAFQLILDQP